ncbi:hypothetical protein [Acrocarpospora sp. B8E8]|uniref:DUF7167 family protein n=1 Tax=Acrocarpospora sp. B8E8 TaxID=3153572 RepID=UPI00325D0D0C
MSEETVKVKIGMSVGYINNSTTEEEVDTGKTSAEWDALTDEEKDDFMQPTIDDFIGNNLDSWWTED